MTAEHVVFVEFLTRHFMNRFGGEHRNGKQNASRRTEEIKFGESIEGLGSPHPGVGLSRVLPVLPLTDILIEKRGPWSVGLRCCRLPVASCQGH